MLTAPMNTHHTLRRSAVVIMDSRSGLNRIGDTGRVPRSIPRREEGVLHADNTTLEATVTEAREKLRLLTLQTLKYSTIWLIVRVRTPFRRPLNRHHDVVSFIMQLGFSSVTSSRWPCRRCYTIPSYRHRPWWTLCLIW